MKDGDGGWVAGACPETQHHLCHEHLDATWQQGGSRHGRTPQPRDALDSLRHKLCPPQQLGGRTGGQAGQIHRTGAVTRACLSLSLGAWQTQRGRGPGCLTVCLTLRGRRGSRMREQSWSGGFQCHLPAPPYPLHGSCRPGPGWGGCVGCSRSWGLQSCGLPLSEELPCRGCCCPGSPRPVGREGHWKQALPSCGHVAQETVSDRAR